MKVRLHGVALTAAVAALSFAVPSAYAENVIRTYAGTGVAGSTGDGGLATNATLNQPAGMAVRSDGALIIAESAGNVIRVVSTSGVISTIAGTGAGSHSGDNGPAVSAAVFGPRDVAFAPDGETLYIAETAGNTIRKISPGGVITTVVGTGTAGSSGDFGPAGSATVSAPGGIGVATNGDLYIADTASNKIRLVSAGGDQLISATDTITTVAGTGTAGLTGDGSPAINGTLSSPTDVTPMPDGSIWIADYLNLRIRQVDPSGVLRSLSAAGTNSTGILAGDGGSSLLASINAYGTIVPDGTGGILVTETTRNRVRRVDAGGIVSTVAGNGAACQLTDLCGDGGAAEVAFLTYVTPTVPAPQVYGANGVIPAPGGRIYIADGNRIRVRVDVPGAGGPTGPAGPAGPHGAGGPAGSDGAPGPAGASGAQGSQGAAGPDGSAGPDGQAGPNGPDGAPGRPGRVGANGPNGQNGTSGPDGISGAQGPAGLPGVDGPQGASGDPLAFIGGTPLVIALPASRIVKHRGRVLLRIYVSKGTSIAARVVKNGYVISTRRVFVRAGLKQLDLGRLGRDRYRIVVTATDGRGHSSADRATLIVR